MAHPAALAPACAPVAAVEDPALTPAEVAETLRDEQLNPAAAADLLLPDGWSWILDAAGDCPDLSPAALVALEAARRELWSLRFAHEAMREAGLALAAQLEGLPAA